MCLINEIASSTIFLDGALPQTPRYFYNNGIQKRQGVVSATTALIRTIFVQN